jgi:hypothetical protein
MMVIIINDKGSLSPGAPSPYYNIGKGQNMEEGLHPFSDTILF